MHMPPVNFLLVDDLPENLLALEGLLRRDGVTLLTAQSGREALEMLLAHDVALALVDVQMPGMDGFELAELMRGTERTRRVPIIFLTAGGPDRGRRFRGYEAGAVDYLEKPVEPDVLRSKVDVFLTLARQRQELAAAAAENARLLAETRRAADAVRRSEAFTRHVLDNLFTFVGVLDLDGTLVEANAAPLRAAGLTLDDVRGKKFWDCYWWNYCDKVRARLQEACAQAAAGQTVRYDVLVRMAGDTRMTIDFQVTPLRGPDGRVTHLIPSAVDLTERRRTEESLRQSEERLRLAKNAAGIGTYDYDVITGLIHWDSRVRELWGLRPDEPVTYDRFLAGVHVDDRASVQAAVDQALDPAGNGRYHAEYRVPGPCGSERRVLATGATTFEGRRAVRLVGTVHDVTDLRHAEAERERLLAILEATPDMVSYSTPDGRVRYMNRAARELLGLPAEGDLADYSIPAGHPEWVNRLLREDAIPTAVRDGKWLGKTAVLTPDGAEVVVSQLILCHRGSDGRAEYLSTVCRDISELRQAEEEVRRSEARLRALVTASAHMVFRASPDWTRFEMWLLRDGDAAASARPVPDWIERYVHPDDRGRVRAAVDAAARSGERFEEEHRVVRADGSVGWSLTRAVPIRDADGRVIEWFGAATDVTERREAEEALRQQDRRKDEFLATLAHELRNPLAPIRTAVQILNMTGPKDQDAVKVREMVERQVNHMVRLVDDLLDLSRISRDKIRLQKQQVSLAEVVQSALEASGPLVEANKHRLTITLPPDQVMVEGDVVRLTQVVANLVNNAAKYTPTGGEITVVVVREGHDGVIRVRDTGLGIPPDMRDNVFEMFTQVNRHLGRSQGGLGIGLSLVRRLVEMHGGTVTAHSEGEGRGAEFTVRLPAVGAVPRGIAVNRNGAHPEGCVAHRVLVVDDNVDAADSLSMLLALRGHDVRTAHDGPAGIDQVGAFRPDVVLLDLGMPGMDGFETVKRLRATEAGARAAIVALTGWGQDEDRRRTREAGFDHHLVKPADPAELDRLLTSLPGGERRPAGPC